MNKKRKEMVIGEMETTISIMKIKEELVNRGVQPNRIRFLLKKNTRSNAAETNDLIKHNDISNELIGNKEQWKDKQSDIDFFKQEYNLSHINDSIDDFVIEPFFNHQSLGTKIRFKHYKELGLITFNKPFLFYYLNRLTIFRHDALKSIEETLKEHGYNLTEKGFARSVQGKSYFEDKKINYLFNFSTQKIYQKGESTIITKDWLNLFSENNFDYSRKGYADRTLFAFGLAYNESTDSDIILEIRKRLSRAGLKNNNGNICVNLVQSSICYRKLSNFLDYLPNVIDDKLFDLSLSVKKMLSKYSR